MLFLLIKCLYWLLVTLIWGQSAVKALQALLKIPAYKVQSFTLYNFAGLALLSVATAIFHFFLPIGLVVNITVLFITGLMAVVSFQEVKYTIKAWVTWVTNNLPITLAMVLIVCYFTSQQSIWIDEGVYHAQFIKWTESYPIVHGLGNLQSRLAFNSQWHVLSALMNWEFATGQESNHINTLLYIIAFVYFWSGVKSNVLQPYSSAFKLLCLIGMHLPFILAYHLIPPSADYFLIIIVWVLISIALEKWEIGTFWQLDLYWLFMIMTSVFAVTVKVSAVPLLFLPAVMLARNLWATKQIRLVAISACLALLFWVPWLISNYYLSGYAVFPAKATAIGHPVWQVTEANLSEAIKEITEWGYTLYKPTAVHVLMSDPLPLKLQKWFFHNIRVYDQLIFLVALAALVIIPLFYFKGNDPSLKKNGSGVLWVLGALLLAIVYWLLTAPDPRFGIGFEFPLVALAILFPVVHFKMNDRWKLLNGLTIAVVAIFWVGSFLLYGALKKQFINDGRLVASHSTVSRYIMPTPYPTAPLNKQGNFNLAVIRTCWGAELPCMEVPDSNVVLIGTELSKGFRYNQH